MAVIPEDSNLRAIGKSPLVGCYVCIRITLQAIWLCLRTYSPSPIVLLLMGSTVSGVADHEGTAFYVWIQLASESYRECICTYIHVCRRSFVRKTNLRRTDCGVLLFSALIRAVRILWYCNPLLSHSVSARAAVVISSNELFYSLLM